MQKKKHTRSSGLNNPILNLMIGLALMLPLLLVHNREDLFDLGSSTGKGGKFNTLLTTLIGLAFIFSALYQLGAKKKNKSD